MLRLQLDAGDAEVIECLLTEILRTYARIDSEDFLSQATVWSQELPRALRQRVNELRLEAAGGGLLIVSGLAIDDKAIGPTPASLSELPVPSPTVREEAFLLLVGCLLGDVMTWSTQQSGRIVQDVFPIRSHQDLQLGTGCRQLLTWHTEDAFHPYRPDYLALFCLRNPQQVPTTVSSIESIDLDSETWRRLSQPEFVIYPDESHRGITDIQEAETDARARISQRLNLPEQVPVVFGNPRHRYWCLDPYFMPPPAAEPARQALQSLIDQIDASLVDVVLQPGELCIMDNYRLVHGRRSFAARFDGTDRWLKRVLVARDLRRSAASRDSVHSRVIR